MSRRELPPTTATAGVALFCVVPQSSFRYFTCVLCWEGLRVRRTIQLWTPYSHIKSVCEDGAFQLITHSRVIKATRRSTGPREMVRVCSCEQLELFRPWNQDYGLSCFLASVAELHLEHVVLDRLHPHQPPPTQLEQQEMRGTRPNTAELGMACLVQPLFQVD